MQAFRPGATGLARLVVLTGLALGLGGCGDVSAGPAAPPTSQPSDGDFRVERRTWGGMCPEGPCRSELVVRGDGAWRLEENGSASRGRLNDEELAAVREAVAATRLAGTAAPSTHCAADSDGTSFGYAWTVDGEEHEVDSCRVAIDPDDPLVEQLADLALRVSG